MVSIMAKGKKFGGRDFAPGNCANPNGRPKVPEDLKLARKLTAIELERIMNELLGLTRAELTELIDKKNQNVNVLRLAVASVLAGGISKADPMKLNFILERLIGKVVEKIEHKGDLAITGSVTYKATFDVIEEK